VAAVGYLAALSSALPGARVVQRSMAETAAGMPLRETGRLLGLWLVAVAPLAATGLAVCAGRVGRRSAVAVAVAGAAACVAVAAPGLWGVGGRLEPVDFPEDWRLARGVVAGEPGTVLALPWHRYYDVSFADGRRVLNPLPAYLGDDILASSDPELEVRAAADANRERTDPRETRATALVERLARGEQVAGDLARLGVRWIALAHEVDWVRWAGLAAIPGIDAVIVGDTMSLYEVAAWRGPVVVGGRGVSASSSVPFVTRVATSGAGVWQRPWADGWMQGGRAASRAAGGLVGLPGGSRTVWFWPSLVVLAADALTLGVVVGTVWRVRRRFGPAAPPTQPPGGDG
jgi:hypothetical protein